MKVLYYSGISFADCDFPLIREYQKEGVECRYVLALLGSRLSGALFSFKKQLQKNSILRAEEYREFDTFKDYLDLKDVYVLNRVKPGMHLLTFWLYIKFVFFILRFRPDAIHVTHPLWGPEFLLYLFRKRLVMTVHDPFLHSGEGDKVERTARKLAFKFIPKFVLLNGKQKDEFVKVHHLEHKEILVNKLGVYDCLQPLSTASEKKGYVLFFGRFSPYKGIEYLCEAMKLVHERQPEIECVIAGGGKAYFDMMPYQNLPYLHIYNRYIETDELATLIDNSAFSVCPYKDATQSGVVFSSFAFCKPVIASNVGALGEAVMDGVTGKLVPAADVNALADAIITLYNSKETLEKMSRNIKDIFFDGEMSWKQIASDNLKFYANR